MNIVKTKIKIQLISFHMDYPLINILSRTANRPKAFAVFLDSLLAQTYTKKRLIISADDNKSYNYCKKQLQQYAWAEIIRTKRVERNPNKTLQLYGYSVGRIYHAPYNLYENELAEKVEQGWMLYLDDDDKFACPDALEIISNSITSPDDLIMWKVNITQAGRIIPEPEYFSKPPMPAHVSGIGFAFHSKYKEMAVWDEFSCCDFRVVSRLWDYIPNKILIDKVLTQTQMIGQGNREDVLKT